MKLFDHDSEGRVWSLEHDRVTELARSYGTPLYLYDSHRVQHQFHRLKDSFSKLGLNADLHYSVKASSTLGILAFLRKQGAKFDVVSGGELLRCLEVGATGEDIVFSGVGKTQEEIELALRHKILQFNVESASELDLISACAEKGGQAARVALRINPDVDALTHEFITTGTYGSKFGVSIEEAHFLYQRHRDNPNLEWVGLDMHIGSQLTEVGPIRKALQRFALFVQDLEANNIQISNLDIGGGLGVNYKDDKVISPEEFAGIVAEEFQELDLAKRYNLILEPGRFIVAESGVLVTEVVHIKRLNRKVYAICDSGLTELMRPSLYGAFHEIEVIEDASQSSDKTSATSSHVSVDIVGPICESTDYFAKDRNLPELKRGDLIAIHNCGAYASSMSHTYNTRARAPEILVHPDTDETLIRKRESFANLIQNEVEIEK